LDNHLTLCVMGPMKDDVDVWWRDNGWGLMKVCHMQYAFGLGHSANSIQLLFTYISQEINSNWLPWA
jgi:hypothetical protein